LFFFLDKKEPKTEEQSDELTTKGSKSRSEPVPGSRFYGQHTASELGTLRVPQTLTLTLSAMSNSLLLPTSKPTLIPETA